MSKNTEIKISLTKEELRFLAGLLMNAKFGLIKLPKHWQPVIKSLADKLSLEDIRQSVK